MFKHIPLATALAVANIAAPAFAQNADLAAVTAHLKSVTTMKAAFAQTDRAGRTMTGQLTLKRPGKIRFQYADKVPLLIVADGNRLTFIDYSVKQVQSWPIGNSPMAVLLDANKDLSRFMKVLPAADSQYLLAETHDVRHPEYGVITLSFLRQASAPGGLMLQGWVALDSQGNRTSVRLSGQQFNMSIGDEAFRWRDPRPTMKGH